jgi:hypothetical protein
MNKHFLILIILWGCFSISQAEKAPIKFGQINKADLINNVYAPDTSAPAVVLCDYGYFTESRFQTVRTLRIKILKKEGYDWANQTFNSDSKTSIKGVTYNLVDNEIVETKLKNESIFKTRVTDDIYEIRVAMPNVKVGSIIDIQFMYDGIPSEWDFQQEIPVVHSELVLEPSSYVTYSKNFFGYIGLATRTNDRWVSVNVPAFKPEPYMTSSKNYRSRLEFDYESVSYPGYYRSFTTSWEAVRDLLYNNTYFGTVLNTDGYLRSVAKDIKARNLSQEEMIKVAYDYTKQIKWDKTYRLYTDKTSLNSSFKEGKGNSSEINLALVQLLRKLDIDAGPVVMSTRSNGRLSAMKPSYNKLNYVIAAAFTEKDTLLLDATEAKCPYYLLPMRTLNGQAQFMDKNRTGWVQLTAKKKDKQVVIYSMSIGDDLSLKGKLTYSKGDYAALDFRNDYEDFNSDEAYITDFKEGKKGLKVISHKVDNLDSLYMPINEEFEVAINNSISDIDGELYITPLLYDQMKENPFKVSERNYPIDYGYARDKTILVYYTLPQGYTVANMPTPSKLLLPGNAGSFVCVSSVVDGKISISYKLNINKSLILQSEYSNLREFYNQIVAKEAEPIVLKKN